MRWGGSRHVDIYTVKGKAGSRKESAAFVRYLTEKAHDLGLGIGLKNAVELIEDVPDVDWYVNESCVTFGECGKYASVAAKKAVFAVEYCDAKKHLGETTQNPTCACSKARKHGLNMLIKRVDLDGDRMACDERLFVWWSLGMTAHQNRPTSVLESLNLDMQHTLKSSRPRRAVLNS